MNNPDGRPDAASRRLNASSSRPVAAGLSTSQMLRRSGPEHRRRINGSSIVSASRRARGRSLAAIRDASRDDVSAAPVGVDDHAQHAFGAGWVARGNAVGDLAVARSKTNTRLTRSPRLASSLPFSTSASAPARSMRASDWANIGTS